MLLALSQKKKMKLKSDQLEILLGVYVTDILKMCMMKFDTETICYDKFTAF